MTTELDIAKAIQSGDLASPQQYENIWLFDVRVTGTGTSYRQALNEYVYRPPENFLTEEFVQRCNGLPLIFEHPKKAPILNTEEFRDRSIGTVILPYIKGDEVWGIAKVFDDDAAQLMRTSHASTSPAVVFRDAGSTETVQLDDGSTVLIEGNPSYLDHLAICEEGVWDKGGEPTGVNIEGDSAVDENQEKAPAWADALMQRVDSVCSRLDAIENKGEVADSARKDEAKEAAEDHKEERKDEARKDSEKEAEKEGEAEHEEEEKAVKAEEKAEKDGDKERKAEERADAQARENANLRKQIAAMNERMNNLTRPLTASDRDALSHAQARADGVASMFGDSVAPPLHGESPIDYRKRLAAKFQKHSERVGKVRLDSLDAQSFDLIEAQIYADAQTAAKSPAAMPEGRLRAHVRKDSAGREITEYTGDPLAWMSNFMAPGMHARFTRNQKGA